MTLHCGEKWDFVSERTRDEIKTTEQWNQIVALDDTPLMEICFDSDKKTDAPGVDDDGYEPLELRDGTKSRWDGGESLCYEENENVPFTLKFEDSLRGGRPQRNLFVDVFGRNWCIRPDRISLKVRHTILFKPSN